MSDTKAGLVTLLSKAAKAKNDQGQVLKRLEFAEVLGVSPSQLYRIKRGEALLPVRAVPVIADLAQVSREYVLYTAYPDMFEDGRPQVRTANPAEHGNATPKSYRVPQGYRVARHAINRLRLFSATQYANTSSTSLAAKLDASSDHVALTRPVLTPDEAVLVVNTDNSLEDVDGVTPFIPMLSVIEVMLTPSADNIQQGSLVLVQFLEDGRAVEGPAGYARFRWYQRQTTSTHRIVETYTAGVHSPAAEVVSTPNDRNSVFENQRLLLGVATRVVHRTLYPSV